MHSWPLMLGLTREIEMKKVLENACRLAGFVVSQDGGTPVLPNETKTMFTAGEFNEPRCHFD